MQLHSDKVFHSDRTYSPSSARTSGNRGTLRLLPTPRTLPIEELQNEISDQRCVLKRGDYSIRLADSPGLRSEASALIERMYSWRGYHTENAAVFSHNPNRLTLVASSGQKLLGTVTLGLDSEEGLLADELYGQEINAFRAKGKKVCELSKFALDPQYSSKEILASLFHLAYIYAHKIHKATDLFGEVNPRHAGSQKRMFGFRQISEVRTCPRVDAPAVLLHLGLDYVRKQISSLAGSPDPKERSLYPYCFSQQENGLINSVGHTN